MFKLKLLLCSICISLLSTGLFCSSGFSAILTFDDDQLMGADGILVNGIYYDVKFIDGTADALYNGDDGYIFTFTDSEGAKQATEALFSQVFYDDYENVTNNINGLEGLSNLTIFTPYGIAWDLGHGAYAINIWRIRNHIGEEYDLIFEGPYSSYHDTSDNGYLVWAKWSVAKSVPVPSTSLLLGSGLYSLVGLRRKQQFNKA